MIRRIAGCSALLLALSGCGGYASRASFGPEAGPVWDASSDEGEIASWALRRCRWGSLAARRNCVERGLGSVIRTAGVAKAMAALDRIAARDGDMLRESHGLAHGLGIAAYRGPGTVAQDFAACPPTQISGCYHGVIQGYFLDVARRRGDVGAEELNALCEPHRASGILYFQCTHGMGHGLMAMLGNHLPASLEKCDLVTDAGARGTCYGGAFMENIVAVTHPEHTAHSHAEVAASGQGGHEEHGGHGNHGSEADHGHHGGEGDHAGHAAPAREAWKPLDRRDPLYPCTAVAERYRFQCYLIQTSAILAANRGDIARTAKACAKAPEAYVSVCRRSLGRDVTAYSAREHAKTVELCRRAGEAAFADCVRGAAETLVNVASDPRDGLAFCRVVTGAAAKAACYEAVGEMIRTVVTDAARKEEHCAAAEPDHVARCRAAAALAAPEAVGG